VAAFWQHREPAARPVAVLRPEQCDPRRGGRAARLRGQRNAAHQRTVLAWQGELPDPDLFINEILPSLRDVPIMRLATATGLSEHYCSLIRLGKRVPNARHWDTLRAVACGVEASEL
jgi:hypothetical protein